MLASGQKIMPEKTLIIFDEIQNCPDAINSLKYFCENAPEYHVACAGSLLGVTLAKPSSFPAGKVNFMEIDPMTTYDDLSAFKIYMADKVKLRVRFSLNNLRLDDDVLNIPLFMADHTDRLIGMALEQRRQQRQ